jgi:hypothetical protein
MSYICGTEDLHERKSLWLPGLIPWHCRGGISGENLSFNLKDLTV